MIRRTFAIVAVILLAAAQGVAQDPLLGTWKLNHDKSEYNPGPPPQSLVIRFEPFGDNGVKYTQDQITPQGTNQHVTYTMVFDGKDYPMVGDPGRDMISSVRIDTYTIEQTSKLNGRVTSTSRRVIAPDGKSMVTTQRSTNAQGQPVHNEVFYEKQ